MAGYELSPSKLAKAGRAGFLKQAPERQRREARIRMIAGPNYGPDTKSRKTSHLNLLYQAQRTLTAFLVPRDPRCAVRPRRIAARPASEAIEYQANDWGRKQQFKSVVRRLVREAMVSPWGIALTGLRANGDMAKVNNVMVNLGEPFVSVVDFNDYVLDPAARVREERFFERISYRVSKEYFLSLNILEGRGLEKFKNLKTLDQRDAQTQDARAIMEEQPDQYELTDLVELHDFYVYRNDGIEIATMSPSEGDDDAFLALVPYEGPPGGPIEVLAFEELPGPNPIPVPILSQLEDLSRAADEVCRKLVENLKQAKNVLVYQRGEEDSAAAITKAKNLQAVAVDNIQGVQMLAFQGILEQFFAGVSWLDAQWNVASGNLHTIGGGSDPKKTATAAVKDNANAGVIVGDMSDKVIDVTGRLFDKVGWWFANDPLMKPFGTKRIEGGHLIDVHFDPDQVEMNPYEHEIDVDAISMKAMDPVLRMSQINQFMTGLPAMAELWQAQIIDLPKYLKIFSREYDIPELEEIVLPQLLMAQSMGAPTGMMPPEQPMGPGGGGQQQNNGQSAGGRFTRPIDQQRSVMSPGVPAVA